MSSRRDFLQAFLGAPLALGACARGSKSRPVHGELVDSLESRGHGLRDEAVLPMPESEGDLLDVVVVGGGVAGLSARARLSKAGLRVALVEADGVLGGTAKCGENQGGMHPWGAHYVTAPLAESTAMVRLLEEVGVVVGRTPSGDVALAEECVVRAPEERLFHLGHWEEGLYPRAGASADDLAELERFRSHVRELAARRDGSGRRPFIAPLGLASSDADVLALDGITMDTWLAREGYRSARLRWLVDYACRDDFGLRVEATSAWAALFYFAARSGPGGEPRAVIPWPEGNGRLVAHLAQKGAGELWLRSFVRRIAFAEDGSETRVLVADGAGDRHVLRARRVVLAVPRFIGQRIVDGLAGQGSLVEAPSYGSWVVANLTLSNTFLKDEPPIAWDNVIHASPSLGYVSARHQLDVRSPHVSLTHYYALCDADPKAVREKLLAIDHAGWCDVVLRDLECAHPRIRDHVERIDVLRWGHAMVRPIPGVRTAAARGDGQRPFRSVHFAHTELSAVALFEEAFWHGTRAAEEVIEALGRPLVSELGR